MCASHWGVKPKGAMKVKATAVADRIGSLMGAIPAFASTSLVRSSKSIHVGTRKMVNYA
jgi:hypothetical protein